MQIADTGLNEGYAASLAGIAQGVSRMQKANQSLVREPNVDAIVSSKLAKSQVEASTKVVQAFDEVMGHLIDTLG